jgi:hypothetical protein
MNKYQKQALVDLAKVAILVLVSIAVVGFIIQAGVSANDVVGTISLIAVGYCVYQLYLIRVGQLESEDKLTEMERKYK